MGRRSDNSSPAGPTHDAQRIRPWTIQSSGSDIARGPLRCISVMPWGISPPSNIRRLLQVPKTDTPVSKVGPLFVKNNPKGLHLHEKSSKAIITSPLRKTINRKRIGEEGVRQWKIKNQRVRELERERNQEQTTSGRRQAIVYQVQTFVLEASHCRISIHPLQQVNCEPNKTVSPLTEVWVRTQLFNFTSYKEKCTET